VGAVGDVTDLQKAQQLHANAAAAFERATAQFEAAVIRGDRDTIRTAGLDLDAASEQEARAGAALAAARRATAPSFDRLLADPTQQLDARSRILASIVAYATAVPASAGKPLPAVTVELRSRPGEPHVWHSGTVSGTAEPLTAAG
jgi:hypothetical protein